MRTNVVLNGRGGHYRSRSRGGRIVYLLLVVLILAALAAGAYVFFRDLSGPEIVMEPMSERIAPDQEITLTVTDKDSAVRSVTAVVRYSGETLPIFEKDFSEELNTQKLMFSLKNAGLKDGAFTLEIVARDTSLAGLGRGNRTTLSHEFILDTQPPRISLRTPPTNLRRGSVAVFVYGVSEDVESTGIAAGEIFFPAFSVGNGLYCCYITLPMDVPLADFVPRITATDKAGNSTSMGLSVHLQERKFKTDRLNISDTFLNQKAVDFETIAPGGKMTPLERYVHINGVVRVDNEKTLRELAAKTAPVRLWTDVEFQRLPGSALRANYGDSRTYYYKDQPIDHQTHMGLDLASTAHAPIPAANDGRVVFSGPLGIFGNLVIIDHGMGLMSLYSHMSQILVMEGDVVKKGQVIAYTGTTGLAGGDHLHFGMLVHGFQVQPVDWLDKHWVRAAIIDRVDEAVKH